MWNWFRKRPAARVCLEEQLQVLESLGMTRAPGVTIDHFLRSHTREEYETRPYDWVFYTLGGDEHDGDHKFYPVGATIWGFDTERVEDTGAYADVVRRMSEIAHPDLPLRDIKDFVDVENEVVWVSFVLDGHEMRLEPEFKDDWFDMSVIVRLADLLRARKPNRTLAIRDPCDQSVYIWCASDEQIAAMRRKTGVTFIPLHGLS